MDKPCYSAIAGRKACKRCLPFMVLFPCIPTEGLPALIALLTVLTDAVVKQLDFHARVSVNVVDNVRTIR